jgi:hypothetical protein
VLAGILAALCLWFSWRALLRCRAIHSGALAPELESDPLELRLAERELNLELNLAGRKVKTLGRVSLFGGTGLALWFYATGVLVAQPLVAFGAFAFGLIGWGGCREFHRRIGSLADSWRETTNKRRRRQGVDP